jgi:hypothetical protein
MPYDNGVRRHLVIKFEFDFLGKLSLGNARILGASLSLDETLPRAGGLNPPTFSARSAGSRRTGARRRACDS